MPNIRVGDIVLYPVGPTSRLISKLVGFGQRVIGQDPSPRQYSHVALVGPDPHHIFEAYWPMIRESDIKLDNVEIYRIIGIKQKQVDEMMTYCLKHLGDFYDMASILTFGLIHVGGTEVCSEFVFNAALAAGIVLYPPEYFESPDDIAASKKIIRVR